MPEDNSKNIINLGILAHVDAGKTTLTEQLLFRSGRIRKAGSVDSGTTCTDWLEIERKRGISVLASETGFEWKGVQVNLIDTPGHSDFAGEVERVLPVLDCAVLVVSAVEGIQSHTEAIFEAIKTLGMPALVFINKLDRAGSRAEEIERELNERLGGRFIPLCVSTGEGTREAQVSARENLDDIIIENAADFDDALAEDWLAGEKIDIKRAEKIFRAAIAAGEIYPVLRGCAISGMGIEMLLDTLARFMPRAEEKTENGLCGRIFRVTHDKTMGRTVHVRMYGGEFKNRDEIKFGAQSQGEEPSPGDKITQIRRFDGSKYTDVSVARGGDIVALCGVHGGKVGDWFGKPGNVAELGLASPFLTVRAAPKNPAELTKLVDALRELADEDPLIRCRWEKSEREIDINITGSIQREILGAILKDRYNLEAEFSSPTVIYKETPASTAEGFSRYTMPKPCWAMVNFRIEPLARGAGIEYGEDRISNDRLFYRYRTQIRESFYRSIEQGRLNWEVTDMRCTLIDGMHHTIHTHPLDFAVCTPMALLDGLENAGTTLLEPVLRCRFRVPEEYLSRLMGDIPLMRGEYESPVFSRGGVLVEAKIPAAECMDYGITLAGYTRGTGNMGIRFDGYEPCPPGRGSAGRRRGVDPRDREKWILYARGALEG